MEISQKDFIRGKSVETPFGKMRFLSFGEYMDYEDDLSFISQNVLHLYYMLRKNIDKKNKDELENFKSFKELKLLEVVTSFPDIFESYVNVLVKMLDINEYDERSMHSIINDIFSNNEPFDRMRNVIMQMNLLEEEKVAPDEELQHWFDIEKEEKRKKSKNAPTTVDMMTSIVAKTSFKFNEVEDMNLFQVRALFERIDAIIAYETSTIYRSVGAEIKVESWAKKIDMFAKQEDSNMSVSEFSKLNTDLFG